MDAEIRNSTHVLYWIMIVLHNCRKVEGSLVLRTRKTWVFQLLMVLPGGFTLGNVGNTWALFISEFCWWERGEMRYEDGIRDKALTSRPCRLFYFLNVLPAYLWVCPEKPEWCLIATISGLPCPVTASSFRHFISNLGPCSFSVPVPHSPPVYFVRKARADNSTIPTLFRHCHWSFWSSVIFHLLLSMDTCFDQCCNFCLATSRPWPCIIMGS